MPYIQLALLLAALATVGPFSIDTYLPALHAIGSDLGASQLQVQQTLTAYMLPMAAMVLWHGALSDAWGRKRVIVVSMLLFALASLVCVFAGSIETLLIGRALLSRPRLLLLDEPSMGLAPLVVEKIFEVIRSVAAEGVTILLVEQNANLALEFSQRAYVMESGRITLAGSGAELLADPKVRAAYLGE